MRHDWRHWAATVAGWLPAAFWLAYAIWNTVWLDLPRLGPLTPINVLYLAMVPALVATVASARRATWFEWPGQRSYLAFLAIVFCSLVWAPPDPSVETEKLLLIYSLLGLTLAQLAVSTRAAIGVFVASLIVVAVGLSAWTVGHAVASGFSYRGALPVNPNLPATLIAPGLLAAYGAATRRDRSAATLAAIAATLTTFYGCLLLGSRGVLVAVIPALIAITWRQRPSLRRALTLAGGAAGVIALAQTPAIPHALWTRTVTLIYDAQPPNALTAPAAESSRGAARRSGAATAPRLSGTGEAVSERPLRAGETAVAGRDRRSTGTEATTPPIPPPLAAGAANSTALARFGEAGVETFNLRGALWLACLRFATSGVGTLLVGGGMGRSDALSHAALPVFNDSHQAWLQVLVDFGVIGLLAWSWTLWSIARALSRRTDWPAAVGLGALIFWAIAGLTMTVTDMHVFWVSVGVAAGSAGRLVSPAVIQRQSSSEPLSAMNAS